MRTLLGLVVIGVLVGALSSAALAGAGEDEAQAPGPQRNYSVGFSIALIGTCLAAAVCVVGGGMAIARIGSACIEAIARQPEAAASMFAPMIVSAAMVEGGMLFAIVVCLLGVLKLSV